MDDNIGVDKIIASAKNRQTGCLGNRIDHQITKVQFASRAIAFAIGYSRRGGDFSMRMIECNDSGSIGQEFCHQFLDSIDKGRSSTASHKLRFGQDWRWNKNIVGFRQCFQELLPPRLISNDSYQCRTIDDHRGAPNSSYISSSISCRVFPAMHRSGAVMASIWAINSSLLSFG